MTIQPDTIRKVTISLPQELVEFVDVQATRDKTSRSEWIARALVQCRERELERLAAEGYRFYAEEAAAFAAASESAVAEGWDHGR
jgi:metal-responsive CopG/Arc/MetJ family transcriptional regulator